MLVSEKYRLQREIGWSDEAEVHSGPTDPATGVPIAVKIRHGMGGPPRPNGNRERFLRAVDDQKAAATAGCRQIAPIFESGHEGDNAYYVTRHYQRSPDSLIKGHVTLEASALHRLTEGVLRALEELRDRRGRAHGNLKPTNIFLDGKHVQAEAVYLSDLALPEDAVSQAADCYALGATLFQLVRGRAIRNFDWPIQEGPEWNRLGPQADAWREFCNVLMAPDLASKPDALATARRAFKNMRRLGAAAIQGVRDAPSSKISWRPSKGLLAAAAGVVGALAIGTSGIVLWLLPADSKTKQQLRNLPLLASFFHLPEVPKPQPRLASPTPLPASQPTPAQTAVAAIDSPVPNPSRAVTVTQAVSPPPGPVATPTAAPTPSVAPTPEMAANASPTPPPENPGDKWLGYTAVLQQFQQTLHDATAPEQVETLNAELTRLKDDISFSQVAGEPSVAAFLHLLPPKLEATGDQAALPANLWKKDVSARQDDVQSVTYQWGQSGFRFQFIRVSVPTGNAPSFYLSTTTVPVQFGFVLARMAEADGKGQISGAQSVRGPVAWEYTAGNFALRSSWMLLDSINAPFYANTGRPSGDSPMNGLSAIDALRLAHAAGCSLPTLVQWNAVLGSPAGQQWVSEWQSAAKVRSPQWSAYAKGIQAQHITGAKLPNDQCFGDKTDLSAVTPTASQNLFFEPVNTRVLKGFAHLIGNVGQYVVDDARNPSKYYFAGGSAEAAPLAFQSLTAPPAVISPFLSAADGGLRLAVAAQGNGSDKNPPLDKLKTDLDAELVRVQKLQ